MVVSRRHVFHIRDDRKTDTRCLLFGSGPSAYAADNRRHSAAHSRDARFSHTLRAGKTRTPRAAFRAVQVPLDDRNARARRRAVTGRSAADGVWGVAAQAEPRRAAAALERAERRHEPDRAAPAAYGVPPAIRRQAGAQARGAA